MTAITRQLLATVGATTVRLALTWNPARPFEVVMDTYPRRGPVRWVFAWDLLEDGIHHPAGVGYIRIYPMTGRTVIVLCPPGPEQTVLVVPTEELTAFLADTWIAEPPELPDCVEDIDFGEVTER